MAEGIGPLGIAPLQEYLAALTSVSAGQQNRLLDGTREGISLNLDERLSSAQTGHTHPLRSRAVPRPFSRDTFDTNEPVRIESANTRNLARPPRRTSAARSNMVFVGEACANLFRSRVECAMVPGTEPRISNRIL
jgi:hypothetical protein